MTRQVDTDRLRRAALALLWIAMAATITAVVATRCHHTPGSHYVQPTASARDSLLWHKVTATQRVDYEAFTSYFDPSRHQPACVTYELTTAELTGDASRTDAFATDSTVPGCPLPDAYRGSGLHRGHLAPAADMHWSDAAMRQSFLMTNICPQHRSLNEGGWGRLEEKCREWVRRDHALLIACGPVPDSGLDTLPGSGVTVPRRFYKVVLAHCARPMRALAFVYPNAPANGPLSRYVTTIDQVEQLTGIDFFALLPIEVQQQFEANSNLPLWLH